MQATALILEVERVADDDFNLVVRQREAQLLRIAFRILGNWADAEEVAQESFLKLHRHGLGFASEAALGAWLYRVTVNLCIDRSRNRRPGDELPALASPGASAESVMLQTERKQLLLDALATLPAKERAALVLREIEGLETAEVASILGSSEVTIRSQISRAMSKLRALLTKEAS